MPHEHIGDAINVETATHPKRSDSPEYRHTRKWLMTTPGGCYICGGPVDLSHPEASPPITAAMQDHHGGGLYRGGALVGFNLFPLEWSMGWGADPAKVDDFVRQLSVAGLADPFPPIHTTVDVMRWVDGPGNANVRLCLAADSPVLMSDGREVPIAEVMVGDHVIGHDGRAHRVTGAYSKPWSGDLVVVDGIGMTPEHPVLTPSGWVEASRLSTGGGILRVLGEHVSGVGGVQPEVFKSVIGAVAIDVMHRLLGVHPSAERPFHHQAMLHDHALLPILPHADASVARSGTSFETVESLAGQGVESPHTFHVGAGAASTAVTTRPVLSVARGNHEWLAANFARLGDPSSDRSLVSVRTGWRPIRETRRVGFHGHVHDISVEGSHSFVSGGFAVHNCAPHHVGHQTTHTPDSNGHEAVGIHNAPWPILAAQATCEWARWDMWGGSTGTVAVAPHPGGDGRAVVIYTHDAHPTRYPVGTELPATHPHARAAHAGHGSG